MRQAHKHHAQICRVHVLVDVAYLVEGCVWSIAVGFEHCCSATVLCKAFQYVLPAAAA